MSILQQREVKTAADLMAMLAPLGDRPLSQIITVVEYDEETGNPSTYHNQIEYFIWDTDKKELEVQL